MCKQYQSVSGYKGNRHYIMPLLAAFLGSTLTVAQAHHSVANFDMQKTTTIEGTVQKLEWTNPHMWLWVVVSDKSGKTEEWGIEGASPANMQRRAGWTKRSVLPGEKVIVELHPFRDGRPGGSISRVIKADGSELRSGGGDGSGVRKADD